MARRRRSTRCCSSRGTGANASGRCRGRLNRIARMTGALRLEPADEYPHPPDDVINFNESVYASGWDANPRMGGWMRLGNRVNEGYAELSVCLYLPDGRVACQFERPPIDAQRRVRCRRAALRRLGAVRAPRDGLRRRADGARRPERPARPEADVRDGSARRRSRCASTCAASRPMHGGEPTTPEQEQRMYYGLQFSRGHFNQHTAVDGLDPGRRRGVPARRVRLARPLVGAALLAGDLGLPAVHRQLRPRPRLSCC